ncbi:uncharacterized protein ISCGN_003766 [Ixodes scapularis]
MATDEATPLDITVVRTLRLPRFWTADPQLWFAQVESQFTTSHITSQAQRFHHVVAALPPETAVDIRDIILEPPTTNPYDNLKAELVKRTSASEHQRLQRLLTSEELGDRTPSQLLRRLQQLLGERAATFDPALLRELFLQRLPNNEEDELLGAQERLTKTEPRDCTAPSKSIGPQLESFLEEPRLNKNEDILRYWENHKLERPELYRLAKCCSGSASYASQRTANLLRPQSAAAFREFRFSAAVGLPAGARPAATFALRAHGY